MSAYEIFKTDIQPKGFKVIAFTDFLTDDCVAHSRAALQAPALVDEMTAHNYELGRRYYSWSVLENRLIALLNECLGLD